MIKRQHVNTYDMRKCLIFCVLCMSSILLSQADTLCQGLTPTYAMNNSGVPAGRIDTFYECRNSDTINGMIWNKILRYSYDENGVPLETGFIKTVGYIRREEQKAYYKNYSDFAPQEGLLYDFTLSEGDTTIVVAHQNYLTQDSLYAPYVVDSIVNIDCSDGGVRKIMFLHSLTNFFGNGISRDWRFVWIEGLGDSYHPYLPTTCIDGSGSSCDIFHDDFTVFDGMQWITVDEIPCNSTSTSVENIVANRIWVSPNPVSSYGELAFKSDWKKMASIELFAMDGKLFYSIDEIGNYEYRLDLSGKEVPKGVFFSRITLENGQVQIFKLVRY